jgi:hypothetical protein
MRCICQLAPKFKGTLAGVVSMLFSYSGIDIMLLIQKVLTRQILKSKPIDLTLSTTALNFQCQYQRQGAERLFGLHLRTTIVEFLLVRLSYRHEVHPATNHRVNALGSDFLSFIFCDICSVRSSVLANEIGFYLDQVYHCPKNHFCGNLWPS